MTVEQYVEKMVEGMITTKGSPRAKPTVEKPAIENKPNDNAATDKQNNETEEETLAEGTLVVIVTKLL